MPREKYPWADIKAEYVEGSVVDDQRVFLSVPVLAEKWNVPKRYMQKRASKKRWTHDRAEFKNQLEIKRREAKATELATRGIKFDTESFNAANVAQRVAYAMLAKHAKAVSTNDTQGLLETLDLIRYMNIVQAAQKVGRLALGEPTSIDEHQTEVPGMEVGSEDEWPTFLEKYGPNLFRKWFREQVLARGDEPTDQDSEESVHSEEAAPGNR